MGKVVELQAKFSSLEPFLNDQGASAPELDISKGTQQLDADSSQLQVGICLSQSSWGADKSQ